MRCPSHVPAAPTQGGITKTLYNRYGAIIAQPPRGQYPRGEPREDNAEQRGREGVSCVCLTSDRMNRTVHRAEHRRASPERTERLARSMHARRQDGVPTAMIDVSEGAVISAAACGV